MSADDELGYVYLPVSSTTHNHYGGERPGANLFSQTLVCLKAATGERVWHYQLIHHGPVELRPASTAGLGRYRSTRQSDQGPSFGEQTGLLLRIRPHDRRAGLADQRARGAPVANPRRAKLADPALPQQARAPTTAKSLQEEDLIDFTPELREKALAILQKYEHGPLFTPPSEKGTLVLPGGLGGSDWSGAALVPKKNVLYVPSRTRPDIVRLEKVEGLRTFSDYAFFKDDSEYVDGLPLTKPPYGRITAIDLDTGEHVWMSPVGKGPINHKAPARPRPARYGLVPLQLRTRH